jgi:hypothetical protein
VKIFFFKWDYIFFLVILIEIFILKTTMYHKYTLKYQKFHQKMRDGAESKTRPSNLPDINLNQSELTRDTYLVRVNPHKSSSNSRK